MRQPSPVPAAQEFVRRGDLLGERHSEKLATVNGFRPMAGKQKAEGIGACCRMFRRFALFKSRR